jgi:hypothetical protein
MPNITSIIQVIDEELEKSGRTYLTPLEASLLLQRKNILKDNHRRPGLPLRNILRNGGIPHAFQMNGKWSEWRIPHSSNKRFIASNYYPNKLDNNISDKKPNLENERISLEEINKARVKYKPANIKYLLIAEAPPDNIERFFYYSDVKRADGLFLGIMEALYPDLKQYYLKQRRNSKLKVELLEKFKGDGFYLIDLFDFPISFNSLSFAEISLNLLNRVKCLVNDNTKIILLKANVHDLAFQPLKGEGFSVINKRINFPAYQGWHKFQLMFKEALIEAGYFKNI